MASTMECLRDGRLTRTATTAFRLFPALASVSPTMCWCWIMGVITRRTRWRVRLLRLFWSSRFRAEGRIAACGVLDWSRHDRAERNSPDFRWYGDRVPHPPARCSGLVRRGGRYRDLWKVIGGGLPLAAVVGRRQYLDTIDGGQWDYGRFVLSTD